MLYEVITLLEEGVNIVIGTPGRLMDFATSGKINFRDFGILIIDEADRMFDMGFYPDIMQILRKMGKAAERTTLLFSATLVITSYSIHYTKLYDSVLYWPHMHQS